MRGALLILEKAEFADEAGAVVVGHNDWAIRQMRWLVGDAVHVVYDWDSLIAEREPIVVGGAARGFTMTYDTPMHGTVPEAPGTDELVSFGREYEASRGRSSPGGEWHTLGAAAAYSMAYSSRCGHARVPQNGPDALFPAGSYLEALARYGEELLQF